VKPLFTLADAVTALRIPLAAVFPLTADHGWHFAMVAVAAGTDFLDGRLARRVGPSRIGVVLDPVADKLFMLAAFLTVAQHGLLTWWELLLVLSRDIVAAVAALGVLLLGRPMTLPARAGGKAVTVCQLLTLVAYIAESPLVRPLAWATAAISMYAIWDYSRAAARATHHA
jgi:phosphatidylglycerophosphate synthase